MSQEFRIKLEKELEDIVAELKTIAIQTKDGDWVATPIGEELNNADENVAADINEEWMERRAMMSQLEIRYRNIKRALDKIAENKYGICEISGEPIEKERLMANPAARTNLANLDKEAELPL